VANGRDDSGPRREERRAGVHPDVNAAMPVTLRLGPVRFDEERGATPGLCNGVVRTRPDAGDHAATAPRAPTLMAWIRRALWSRMMTPPPISLGGYAFLSP